MNTYVTTKSDVDVMLFFLQTRMVKNASVKESVILTPTASMNGGCAFATDTVDFLASDQKKYARSSCQCFFNYLRP